MAANAFHPFPDLDDSSNRPTAVGQKRPAEPPDESAAGATVVSPIDLEAMMAVGLSPAAPAKPVPRESQTQVAYAPRRAGAPLPPSAAAPDRDRSRAAPPTVPFTQAKRANPDAAGKRGEPSTTRERVQPFLIPAAAFFCVGVIAFSVWEPSSHGGPPGQRAPAATAAPPAVPVKDPEAAALALRESLALRCLAESTQSADTATRDELLRTAVIEFEKGRLQRAHETFQRYVEMACDRATLEATIILSRRLEEAAGAP